MPSHLGNGDLKAVLASVAGAGEPHGHAADGGLGEHSEVELGKVMRGQGLEHSHRLGVEVYVGSMGLGVQQ